MGDVIFFRPRGPRPLNPDVEKLVDQTLRAMDLEAQRRIQAAQGWEVDAQLLRILALYPMFRLTYAKKARRCVFCGHRIEPMEFHFVKEGAYVCQSGTCVPGGAG